MRWNRQKEFLWFEDVNAVSMLRVFESQSFVIKGEDWEFK